MLCLSSIKLTISSIILLYTASYMYVRVSESSGVYMILQEMLYTGTQRERCDIYFNRKASRGFAIGVLLCISKISA